MPFIYGRIRENNLPVSKNWCTRVTIDKQIATSRLGFLHCGTLQCLCYRFWLQMRTSPLASAHSLAQLHGRLRLIQPYLHCPTLWVTPRQDSCQPAFEALAEGPCFSRYLVRTSAVSHVPSLHCPVLHQASLEWHRYWPPLQLYYRLITNGPLVGAALLLQLDGQSDEMRTGRTGRIIKILSECYPPEIAYAHVSRTPVSYRPHCCPSAQAEAMESTGSSSKWSRGVSGEGNIIHSSWGSSTCTGAWVRPKALSVMPWNGHLASTWLWLPASKRSPCGQLLLEGTSAMWTWDICCLWTQGLETDWDPSQLSALTKKNGTLALPVKCSMSWGRHHHRHLWATGLFNTNGASFSTDKLFSFSSLSGK